jgi:hypothetical protein
MVIEADGVVESITPGGYIDHFDSNQFAMFDTMLLDVSPADGRERSKLRVVLDGPAIQGEQWRVGQLVRFDEEYLGTSGPVFRGTLRNVRMLSEEGSP